jgi:hypothetical protein
MKLDYLDQVNAFGENILRLCDFDKNEAILLRDAIKEAIIIQHKTLDIAALEFVEAKDCNLVFCITEEDEGIESEDYYTFYCNLTLSGYKNMLALMEPFCIKEISGYQWLYDLDNPNDFLFSPSGSW